MLPGLSASIPCRDSPGGTDCAPSLYRAGSCSSTVRSLPALPGLSMHTDSPLYTVPSTHPPHSAFPLHTPCTPCTPALPPHTHTDCPATDCPSTHTVPLLCTHTFSLSTLSLYSLYTQRLYTPHRPSSTLSSHPHSLTVCSSLRSSHTARCTAPRHRGKGGSPRDTYINSRGGTAPLDPSLPPPLSHHRTTHHERSETYV